jgi:mono/diheme cytochrome c family protein
VTTPARIIILACVAGVAVWWFVLRSESQKTGAAMVEIVVPDLAGKAVAGETFFEENCASCHGKNAAGRDGFAPPLIHRIYEPNHHGDQAFYLAVQNGVRAHHWSFGNMPPVKAVDRDQVEQIIAYVRTLQMANGIK